MQLAQALKQVSEITEYAQIAEERSKHAIKQAEKESEKRREQTDELKALKDDLIESKMLIEEHKAKLELVE